MHFSDSGLSIAREMPTDYEIDGFLKRPYFTPFFFIPLHYPTGNKIKTTVLLIESRVYYKAALAWDAKQIACICRERKLFRNIFS